MLPAGLTSHEISPNHVAQDRTDALKFEKVCFLIQKLSELCCTISTLEQVTYNRKERTILLHTLTTTVLQAQSLLRIIEIGGSIITTYGSQLKSTQEVQQLFLNCKFYCTKLWAYLANPTSYQIRHQIATFITVLDTFITKFITPLLLSDDGRYLQQFSTPNRTIRPSIATQITHLKITVDPYLSSLQQNYYYPLSYPDMNSSETDTDPSQVPSPPLPRENVQPTSRPTVVTVEDSMEVIEELVQELQVTPEQEMAEVSEHTVLEDQSQTISSRESNSLRFSLYRTQASRLPKDNTNHLPLLKLFFKCILTTNPQTKILPIQNNSKVSAIKTTSQITELSQIGAANYVKGSRGSRSLAGDYHISTPLSFDELSSDGKIASWLGLNGYKLIYNECQTSDMVLIGILTRVRPFTWRDDLKQSIMNTDTWKKSPFYFRLYYGTFSSNVKSTMTPVLMVEVDRPNIEQGLALFRETFNGEHKLSPNDIPYVFFSLYKNRFTNEERAKIVYDNELHLRQTEVIHMHGIKDIDSIVTLKQNVSVKLRNLLLSLRTPDTNSGKYFLQIEKQNDAEWLTCAFHSTDAERVKTNLNKITSLLTQCIIPEDLNKVFRHPDHKLIFVTKSIPIKKGNLQIASRPIATETQDHTNKMLSKLSLPTMKRFTPDISIQPPINLDKTTKTRDSSSFSSAATSMTANSESYKDSEQNVPNTEVERRFTLLEQSILQGSERMDRLENICTQLMHNTEIIGTQIQRLANDLYNPSSSPGRLEKSSKSAKLS